MKSRLSISLLCAIGIVSIGSQIEASKKCKTFKSLIVECALKAQCINANNISFTGTLTGPCGVITCASSFVVTYDGVHNEQIGGADPVLVNNGDPNTPFPAPVPFNSQNNTLSPNGVIPVTGAIFTSPNFEGLQITKTGVYYASWEVTVFDSLDAVPMNNLISFGLYQGSLAGNAILPGTLIAGSGASGVYRASGFYLLFGRQVIFKATAGDIITLRNNAPSMPGPNDAVAVLQVPVDGPIASLQITQIA
jgi:hypothetical protein